MKDIVIKGKYIVHGIYTFIILILIVLLIAEIYSIRICVNPDQTSTRRTNSAVQTSSPRIVDVGTGSAVQTTTPTSTPTSSSSSNTNDDSSDDEDSSSSEDDEPQTAEPGQVKFIIEDIKYEIKGEDWARLEKIKYRIENGKQDFYPIILAYLFDDNDGEDIRTLEQAKIELPLLEEGEIITKESAVQISFNELDREKTLRLVLRNELGKEVKIALKKFTAE